jgi:hypothetical protein
LPQIGQGYFPGFLPDFGLKVLLPVLNSFCRTNSIGIDEGAHIGLCEVLSFPKKDRIE